jgi:hypothetical protein
MRSVDEDSSRALHQEVAADHPGILQHVERRAARRDRTDRCLSESFIGQRQQRDVECAIAVAARKISRL